MRVNTPGYPGSGKWTLVSKASPKAEGSKYLDPANFGGAIVLKTGGRQCGYVDNIIIWEGTGNEPADKSAPLLHSADKGCSGHSFAGGTRCDDPVYCIWCGEAGAGTPAHTFAAVAGTKDMRCTECLAYSNNLSSSWLLETVPAYSGGKYASQLYRSGQGIADGSLPRSGESLMMIVSGTNAAGFDAYRAKLTEYGYTETYSYSCDGNVYAQYTENSQTVYAYYTASVSEVRVILDKSSKMSAAEFGYTYTKQTGDTTTLFQYGVPMHSKAAGGNATDTDGAVRINCGMMYVIKLADNSVYIMDGGGQQQFDAAQCDGFMKFLREVTGVTTGKIRIAAWSVTHGHSDHMGGVSLFFKKYSSELTLERVFFNLPSYYTETGRFADGRGNQAKMISYIKSCFPGDDIKFIQVHTGQSIDLADIKINVMYTHEDLVDPVTAVSEIADDFNNSCMVLKIIIDSKSFWLLGDINKPAANVIIANNSAATLRGDIVQLSHHVYNSIQPLYEKIQATVVLAPQSSGGSVKSSAMRKIMDTAKKYVQNGMIYYAGDGTDGLTVTDGIISHTYNAPVLGGGYTGWTW